jgi:hypothetical protein
VEVRTSEGSVAGFALGDGLSVAQFYRELFAALDEVGVRAQIRAEPYDLDGPAFPDDGVHAAYDAGAVERWWRVLQLTEHALGRFASRFNGKASPAQLFWHGFDLAHSRFSGRPAPAIEGIDRVTAEAYSHEVISFGWWPGDDRTTPYPAFYSYTAPEPDSLRELPLRPADAEWRDTGSGSLAVLPYDAVRAAPDPSAAVLEFYETAYRAGAATAGWDAAAFATSR